MITPPMPAITPTDRLSVTLFFAVCAHLIVVLGVTFVPEDRPRPAANTLDVVLVQRSSEQAPEEADFIGQANQEGGGLTERAERPATPLPSPLLANEADIAAASPPVQPSTPIEAVPAPAPRAAEAPPPAAEAPVAVVALEQVRAAQALVPVKRELRPDPEPAKREPRPKTELAKAPAAERAPRAREPEPEPAPQAEAAPVQSWSGPASLELSWSDGDRTLTVRADEDWFAGEVVTVNLWRDLRGVRDDQAAALVRRSLAMASLAAEVDQRMEAYAKRPRRKWISARTREHKYAAYMEAWRAKVERVGNLNYPDEARRRSLSGELLLDVALAADGSVSDVIVRRSSGHKVLDDAAQRIVELAAPYARFPESIRKETDILHIQRTWRFLTGNRFASR